MAVANSVLINLEANIAKFEAPIKQATRSLDVMRKSLSLIVPTSFAMLGHEIFNAARYIDSFARSVSSSLNELQRMTEIAGMSVTEFQKWKYAAKMGDIEAQSLAIAFKFLSKNMVEGDKAFEAMNINIKDAITGSFRPLSDVTKDVMDRFASYEDGAAKSAMATRVFGRAGNELIPFFNKGSKGFNELAEEARKLGIILDPEVVAAGSALEDQLKRIDAQVEASKAKLIPYVGVWGMLKQAIYEILAIPVEVLSGKLGDTFKDAYNQTDLFTKQLYEALDALDKFKEGPQESRFLRPGYKSPVPTITPTSKTKKQAWEYYGLSEEAYDAAKRGAEAAEEYGKRWIEAYTKGGEVEFTRLEQRYINIGKGILKLVTTGIMDTAKFEPPQIFPDWKEFTGDTAEADNSLQSFMTHINTSGNLVTEKLETWNEQIKSFRDEWKGFIDEDQTVQKFISTSAGTFTEEEWNKRGEAIQGIATQLGDTWSRVFANMMNGTESFTDTVRDAFKSLADSIIQQIMKMMIKWLMWQAVSGIAGGGASGASWANAIIGIVPKVFAQGGIVNRPTLGVVGESGPEAVIPLNSNKGLGSGGNTYVYISAVDTQSFNDAIRRNPGSVLNVIRMNNRESVYAQGR